MNFKLFSCFAYIGFITANIVFIARPTIYINNAVSIFISQSAIGCCTKCVYGVNCLAVNYNRNTSECELLTEHPNRYLDRVVSKQSWTLFTISDGCGGGWLPFKQSCYLLNGTETSWYDADTHCKTLNAELVDIHSPEENAFVFNYSNSNTMRPIWIGLHSPANESTFYWTSGRPVLYTAYGPGQPDAEVYRHRVVSNKLTEDKWDDRWAFTSALWKMYFVCKRPFHLLT